MDRLIKIAKLIALLAVLPVAVYLCIFLHQLTNTVAEVQTTLKVTSEVAQKVPTMVDTRLASLQTEVLAKIDTVQDKLTGEVNHLANKTDARLGSIQDGVLASVDGLRSDLNGQLTATNKSVDTLVTAYANVPAQVGARYERDFDTFLNCEKNALCLQGQASDTLFAVRDASRSTSATMVSLKTTLPQIERHVLTITDTFATDVPKITSNFASITDNINRLTKPKWYDRLLGYGLNGAILYRNLNPTTNLTIKGTQALLGK